MSDSVGLLLRLVMVVSTLVPVSALAKPLFPLSPSDIQARAAELVQLPWSGKSTNKGTAVEGNCLMSKYTIEVEDPVDHSTRSYDILGQAPAAGPAPVPVVIIVPTIDGTRDFLEPVVARSLCNAGIGSLIADVNDVKPPKVYPSWGAEDVNSRRAIVALRTVADLAERIPRFDKTKIGAIGLSMGGITTSLFASVEGRLKASVIIVGGGNFPHILSSSDHWLVDELRTNRMKAAGFTTVDQYEDQLRASIHYDPIYFTPLANKQKIMMVMAESDVKVPYVDQREQFLAFGQPQSLTFTGGHVDTIIQMVYLYMDDVTTFLNNRFADPGLRRLEFQEPLHKTINLDDLGL